MVNLVLVEPNTHSTESQANLRCLFRAAMTAQGLEVKECATNGRNPGLPSYVLITGSESAIQRQAEFEQVQVAVQPADISFESQGLLKQLKRKSVVCDWIASIFRLQKLYKYGNDNDMYFTDSFQRARSEKFITNERGEFFSESQKIRLVWSIVSSIQIPNVTSPSSPVPSDNNSSAFINAKNMGGLKRRRSGIRTDKIGTLTITSLLKAKVYLAVFPVHDGEVMHQFNNSATPHTNPRNYLYHSWAKFSQWHRYQPLDAVKTYFGEKVGFYFGWLGFYTQMLIFPSLFGLASFIYGVSVATNKNDDIMNDFCYHGSGSISSRIICRDCSSLVCPFTRLQHHCTSATLSRIVDNESTGLFSLFMAIWAVVFVESWKRKQAELGARWDVSDAEFKDDEIRPEYQAAADMYRVNPITQEEEPYLSLKTQLGRLWGSIASVTFFILIILSLVATIVIYKCVGPSLWHFTFETKEAGQNSYKFSPTLMTSITASLVNGVFIAIMSKLYMHVAWKLTNLESPRTHRDFEYSYTYKVFLFQCVNYFGTLFYLAFVRGQNVPPPHLQSSFTQRCPVYGCFLDVSIQLFIIFIGKQTANNLFELGVPLIMNKYRTWKWKGTLNEDDADTERPQWEKDYNLNPPDDMLLLDDYLEMLIQYTFVVMFSPAFPLAPLFALINNIIEMRLDATKHLIQTRRCIPFKAKDIGPWLGLFSFITKAAVLVNALLIAFCTDYVERQVYFYHYAEQNTTSPHTRKTTSFMDFSLTEFQPKLWCDHFQENQIFQLFGGRQSNADEYCSEVTSIYNNYTSQPIDKCYFRDFRDTENNYNLSSVWWHVTLAKLAFILVFENFALGIQTLIQHLISNTPKNVRLWLEREQFIQRQNFMEEEGIESMVPPQSLSTDWWDDTTSIRL